MKIAINKITVGQGRRAVVPEKVRDLAESIKVLGLLNPITVTPNHKLIAGLHRLEAVKMMSWDEVDVNVLDLDSLVAELAEIDENLIRNDL